MLGLLRFASGSRGDCVRRSAVAIMISDTRGLWHADMIRSAAAWPRGAESATGALGLVLTRWRLTSTDAGRNEALGVHELECRRLQAGTLSGFVENLCWATAVLLSPVYVGVMDPRALLKILEPSEVELPPVEDGAPERLSVRTLITRWRDQCEVDILPVECLMLRPLFVGPIVSNKNIDMSCGGDGSTCVQEEAARPHGTNKRNAQTLQ